MSKAVVYEFGDFRLDPANHLLSKRDGTPVALTSRVFDTLAFLVEHHGIVLDKERLMEAVWTDSVVEENNLAQSISKLRQLLGERPGADRFIVTVPGRGYRFAADVNIREDTAEGPQSPPRKPKASMELKPESALPNTRWGVIAALVIISLVAAALFFRSRNERMAPSPALREKSIAVLPFENLGDDKENAYFAAGIQDDVLTSLAQIHELKVISHTSVMAYGGSSRRSIHEIAQALGVTNVLEGSVRHAGNRVLVNVQLIDARDDRHIWAKHYDRMVADSMSLQVELATEIATALRATFAPEEKARLDARVTAKSEAYLLYLSALGRERMVNQSIEKRIAAEQLYVQATAVDPTFALAYARASILNSDLASTGDNSARKAKARAQAQEAVRLAPMLGEAHMALGLCLYWGERNYSAALQEFELAAAISPNNAELYTYFGGIYRRQGHWHDAMVSFDRALSLDPRDTEIALRVANHHFFMRDWPAATTSYTHVLEITPDYVFPKIGLAYLEVVRNSNPAAGRKILQDIPTNLDPFKAAAVTRWDLAMLERDYAAAEKILSDLPSEDSVKDKDPPKTFYQGRTALARGDNESAQRYFAAAMPVFEERVRNEPDNAERHARLGLLYGYMHRKDDAIQEARRAVELEPESQDAFHGALYAANLALVQALVGEPDPAITLIERLLSTPGAVTWPASPESMTLADLRLRWEWDSLRSNPRFKKILAGPEPKTR